MVRILRHSRNLATRSPAAMAVAALSLLLGLFSDADADDSDVPSIVEIRECALASILAVHSIQFDCDVEESHGWKAHGRFLLEEDRFRTERNDVTGLRPGRAPENSISAFDDKRSQFFSESQSRLILKDGAVDSQYTMDAPFTKVFAWLRRPGLPLRWNELRNPATWTQRFGEAQYIGSSEIEGTPVVVVSFPNLSLPNLPCEYRVSFAPTLGYLPLAYERKVVSTGKLASRMQVTRWSEHTIDSTVYAIPLEVTFEQSDADGVSLAHSMTMKIAPDSLKINEDIDDELFTIPRSIATHVHDVDEHQRAFARASVPPHAPTPIAERPRRSSAFIVGIVATNLVFLALFGIFWLRRRRA